jgi:hypothetical protein
MKEPRGWGLRNWSYRRAVTRRASSIFTPESGLRKQDWAKSGQTCIEQLGTTAPTSSRSPFARTATSPASTLGAKPGTAITGAPRRKTIARAERGFTIFELLTFYSVPLLSGIGMTTTIMRNGSKTTTYICPGRGQLWPPLIRGETGGVMRLICARTEAEYFLFRGLTRFLKMRSDLPIVLILLRLRS